MFYIRFLIFIFAKTNITLYRICFHFSYNAVRLDEIFCNIALDMIAHPLSAHFLQRILSLITPFYLLLKMTAFHPWFRHPILPSIYAIIFLLPKLLKEAPL